MTRVGHGGPSRRAPRSSETKLTARRGSERPESDCMVVDQIATSLTTPAPGRDAQPRPIVWAMTRRQRSRTVHACDHYLRIRTRHVYADWPPRCLRTFGSPSGLERHGLHPSPPSRHAGVELRRPQCARGSRCDIREAWAVALSTYVVRACGLDVPRCSALAIEVLGSIGVARVARYDGPCIPDQFVNDDRFGS